MNPIEKTSSKLKAIPRKFAERTVAGLTRALDACADILKPTECTSHFAACGYDPTVGRQAKVDRRRQAKGYHLDLRGGAFG
jgi:hypothetical protein